MLRIALAPCFFHADPARPIFKGKTLLYMEQSLAQWLMRAGALPLMLPTTFGDIDVHDLLAGFGGLVLQGGSDVAPESYGETPISPDWPGDATRDAFEIDLVRGALELDKPVLGVCRGLQIMNVALGGTLYQDIHTQLPGALVHRDWEVYDALGHDICFEEGSALARMYPNMRGARVNSVHHQGVKQLAPSLRCEAKSVPDGIVEAARYVAGDDAIASPFAYAIQWHPEFQKPGDRALLDPTPILDSFLNAVQARRS